VVWELEDVSLRYQCLEEPPLKREEEMALTESGLQWIAYVPYGFNSLWKKLQGQLNAKGYKSRSGKAYFIEKGA